MQRSVSIYEEIINNARRLLTYVPQPMALIALDGRTLWANPAYLDLEVERDGAPAGDRSPVLADDGGLVAYMVAVDPAAGAGARSERDEWYRIVAQNTSDTIVLVDNDSVVRFVSPAFWQSTGYDPSEYEGADAFDVIHPQDRERVRSIHAEVVARKTSYELAYRVIDAQGRTVYVESSVKPVLDNEGNVKYVVAVARDVTERKQSEELLGNILDNVNAAVWSTDKDFTRYSFCSDSIYKLSGIPKEEIMNRPIRLHDHIHPEDNSALMHEIRRRLDLGQSVSESIRWIHVPGEQRWAQLIVHPSINDRGDIERLDGILMDITEKKRSELALEESEQRYKSLFQNNLDGVFSIELDGFHLVNANPVFETITGVDIERLSDRCFLGIIFDEDHPAVYETLSEVVRGGKSKDIECRLARRGAETIVNITFVPIFLSGRLNGIHGIVKDITKRKAEERELIESEKRYKFLQQSLNRLSADLANVMKVAELERRLIEEVRSVLKVEDVAVEEVPHGEDAHAGRTEEAWIRIGEKQHPVYLRIAPKPSLLKIEEEWLETAVRYATILYDNLQLIEDLMQRLERSVSTNDAPKWMLRLLFRLSEKERSTLSSDLHDSVLQDLIIWYRKLESLRSQRPFDDATRRELSQIEEGLLDAIHQIRITCNELRPPFLLKMGLVESLKSLFEYTRMFANYEIEFSADGLQTKLNEEQILGMYRIVQELLNNANKHSGARKVAMSLADRGGNIVFAYSDDGVGMNLAGLEESFQHMGIAGIEKRVISIEGKVEFRSAPGQGFQVRIEFPKL
ncbi:PAS domain S-box protein [Paenibacillus sp.]|uniref:sensor histidine kinase n=1 Tax=Paenibacillus sp. TaxID=58172 RepID=UPI002D367429|nr:PAS domain S-box protein [Paenibacillus sp.]HZG86333.1 PAS domain S-box protein [Paenibacillus sp.]